MQAKRVAVITGAGGGIGLAVCRRLAKDGFFVVVTQDVAALVAFLASEEADYITGEDFLVDGGRTLGPTSQAGRQFSAKAQNGGANA